MHHFIAKRKFVCNYCKEPSESTAAKPVACSKRECQKMRHADNHRNKAHKPRASEAKAPEPRGSNKRHGSIWAELDALIAQEGKEA